MAANDKRMRRWANVLVAGAVVLGLSCVTSLSNRGPGALAEPATRYRLGDYVVYRYSGASMPTPVLLREEVRAQEGNRLRIEVTATRGSERRRWLQVLTDTPDNQRANLIDGLFDWQGERWVRLTNEENRDAFRLYEWTIFKPDGRSTERSEQPCSRTFASRPFACSCTSGKTRWQGRAVRFDESRCSDFLWTHGSAAFVDEKSGEAIYSVEVAEFGRRSDTAAEPLWPAQ